MKSIYFSLLLLSVCFLSCSNNDESKKSANEIISFMVSEQMSSAIINSESATVIVIIDSLADLTRLMPEIIVSEAASIEPLSGIETNFSAGMVKYTVTAQNGDKKDWMVSVEKQKNTEAQILSYYFRGIEGEPIYSDSTIIIEAKISTNMVSVKPTIQVSPKATISPKSGEQVDFSNQPVAYLVTSESGLVKKWTVSVTKPKIYEADILMFTVPNQIGETVFEGGYIYVEVPRDYNLTNVTPNLTISDNCTVTPAIGEVVNFATYGYVDYKVVTEINSNKIWRVYLVEETIKANNPYIQYMGRFDYSNPIKPRFWAPGTAIHLKFKGTFCEILLNDQNLWGGYNYIELIVDNNEPIRIKTDEKTNEIDIIKNLSDGEHTLTIFKDTEADMGYLEFTGLRCDELLEPDPLPQQRIEFIGNSITCGYGLYDVDVPCGTGQWYDQHSAYNAYGPIAARALNAQCMLSSVSGIGLIHSCCDKTFTMPDIYHAINFQKTGVDWDFSLYQTDVVAICLGQNDGIQDSTAFCSAYVQFINRLQSKYANVEIVCMTSPMADESLKNSQMNYLSGVVDHLNDDKVHKLFLTHNLTSGCDYHPNLAEQKIIASEIVDFFTTTLGW